MSMSSSSTPSSIAPRLFCLNRNYSSWSLRGWLAMRASKVDFETEMLIVGTKEYPDLGPACAGLMIKAGPTLKAPALHVQKPSDETHIIFESLAIVEFIAEESPFLWPADRFERAYARSLASEMATSFGAVRNYAMNIRANYAFDPALWNERVEKDILRLSSIWQELRTKAAANKATDDGYLFGQFGALDIMYAPLFYRLRGYDLKSKIQGDLAQAYVERMLDNEFMKEWEAAALLEKEIIPSDELYDIPAPVPV